MGKAVYNRIFNESDWLKVLPENKQILDDYLLDLRVRKLSENTIAQYKNDLRIFLIYVMQELDNKSLILLSKKDLKRYSLYLSEKLGVSSARHNRLLSSLKGLFSYMEDDDDLDYDDSVARKIKGLPKESVRDIVFLTDNEILAMEEKLIADKEYQKATLLMLAYDSALRKNELSQVTKFGFEEDGVYTANKVIGKRHKSFYARYFDETKRCAKLWLKQRGEDDIDNLFIVVTKDGTKKPATVDNIYEMVISMRDTYKELFGKELNFNVHSFRHSALENLGNGTHYICVRRNLGKIDINTLKVVANHESIETTQGYLRDKSDELYEETFSIKKQ